MSLKKQIVGVCHVSEVVHIVVCTWLSGVDRACGTGWMPQEEANDFKEVFVPSCAIVLVSLANRLQKKYSQVSLVTCWQMSLIIIKK